MQFTTESADNISIRGGQIVLQGFIEIYDEVLEKLDYLAEKDPRNLGIQGKHTEVLQKALKSFLDPELKRKKIRPFEFPGKALAAKQDEEKRIKNYKSGIATLTIKIARLDLEINNLKTIPDTEQSVKMLSIEKGKYADKKITMTKIFNDGTKRFKESV